MRTFVFLVVAFMAVVEPKGALLQAKKEALCGRPSHLAKRHLTISMRI